MQTDRVERRQADATDPGAAWDAFCDSLKRAGDVLRRPSTPGDDLTLAEGHRFLSRMVRVALESRLEIGDPLRPSLQPMVGPTLQYEGVTSDARYLNGYIDGSRNYRITGSRGGAPLFEVGVYTGKQGLFEPSHLVASIRRQWALDPREAEELIGTAAFARPHVSQSSKPLLTHISASNLHANRCLKAHSILARCIRKSSATHLGIARFAAWRLNQ